MTKIIRTPDSYDAMLYSFAADDFKQGEIDYLLVDLINLRNQLAQYTKNGYGGWEDEIAVIQMAITYVLQLWNQKQENANELVNLKKTLQKFEKRSHTEEGQFPVIKKQVDILWQDYCQRAWKGRQPNRRNGFRQQGARWSLWLWLKNWFRWLKMTRRERYLKSYVDVYQRAKVLWQEQETRNITKPPLK